MKEYENGEVVKRMHTKKYVDSRKFSKKGKRDEARAHECLNKRSHNSRKEAQEELVDIQKNADDGHPMNIYLCKCGKYHIGHVPKRYIATKQQYFGKEGTARDVARSIRRQLYERPSAGDYGHALAIVGGVDGDSSGVAGSGAESNTPDDRIARMDQAGTHPRRESGSRFRRHKKPAT